PPVRAATVISLINFVNSLPRLASSAPFLCLILCHFECPDIGFQILLEFVGRMGNISQNSAFLLCGPLRISAISVLKVISTQRDAEIRRGPQSYFKASYSLRASASTGRSGSASFQRAKKS